MASHIVELRIPSALRNKGADKKSMVENHVFRTRFVLTFLSCEAHSSLFADLNRIIQIHPIPICNPPDAYNPLYSQ
jgi:hypothetical protein